MATTKTREQVGGGVRGEPGPVARRAARDVPADGHRARRRRADVDPQPRGQDPVRDQRPGPRGRAGGPRLRAAAGPRLDGPVLPLRRVADDLRHEPARDHARPVRARRRPVVGRSADARPLRHQGPQHPVRVVARGDSDPACHGHRLGRQAAQAGHRHDHLPRRGLVEPGRLPRGAQLRRHSQAAGDLRRREQRLCDQRADGRSSRRSRTSPSAPRATTCPASSSTARTS